jgi:hypothetical protein
MASFRSRGIKRLGLAVGVKSPTECRGEDSAPWLGGSSAPANVVFPPSAVLVLSVEPLLFVATTIVLSSSAVFVVSPSAVLILAIALLFFVTATIIFTAIVIVHMSFLLPRFKRVERRSRVGCGARAEGRLMQLCANGAAIPGGSRASALRVLNRAAKCDIMTQPRKF